MTVKERKELKSLMSRIGNASSTIKRAAHECRLDEDSHVEMYSLTLLVEKAKVLMDTLRPLSPTNEPMHGIMLDLDDPEALVTGRVVYTENGAEPEEEGNVN